MSYYLHQCWFFLVVPAYSRSHCVDAVLVFLEAPVCCCIHLIHPCSCFQVWPPSWKRFHPGSSGGRGIISDFHILRVSSFIGRFLRTHTRRLRVHLFASIFPVSHGVMVESTGMFDGVSDTNLCVFLRFAIVLLVLFPSLPHILHLGIRRSSLAILV